MEGWEAKAGKPRLGSHGREAKAGRPRLNLAVKQAYNGNILILMDIDSCKRYVHVFQPPQL